MREGGGGSEGGLSPATCITTHRMIINPAWLSTVNVHMHLHRHPSAKLLQSNAQTDSHQSTATAPNSWAVAQQNTTPNPITSAGPTPATPTLQQLWPATTSASRPPHP